MANPIYKASVAAAVLRNRILFIVVHSSADPNCAPPEQQPTILVVCDIASCILSFTIFAILLSEILAHSLFLESRVQSEYLFKSVVFCIVFCVI